METDRKTRVELIRYDDPWTKLQPDIKGTIDNIDDMGTVYVNWDNGRRLGLIPAKIYGK